MRKATSVQGVNLSGEDRAMTVYEKVKTDIRKANFVVIHEQPKAPCAICGSLDFLRYGCCRRCAATTNIDDPRLVGYPCVGGEL